MLTTDDNPYNPWTQFDQWNEWDIEHGYNTNSYLASIYDIIHADGRVSEEDAHAMAIEDILEQNITGNYIFIPENN